MPGKGAATVGHKHTCPAANPNTSPHTGGPISTGCFTVKIGGKFAARKDDMATCAGPPATITAGSTTVNIGGKPAARRLDPTSHGGAITEGSSTVFIGG